MQHVDLRSDTVTRPTPEMMQAIVDADMDDDCYGTDPTANALEARVAELLGKEAAVFAVTGTMANCIGVGAQTRLGDEVIYEAKAHPINYEAGAPAANLGIQTTGIPTDRGLITADQVREYVRGKAINQADTVLLSVENTHNAAGGTVYPPEQLIEIAEAAHEAGIRAHLDGARLWNAAAATGWSEADLVKPYDTISVCFSKGLGAPIGSALVGDAETVARARKIRRRMGGGWRQAGLVAAAALYALENHRERLTEDHSRARTLATHLAKIAGLSVITPESNIVMVDTHESPLDAPEWSQRLKARGVLLNALKPNRLRLVTHLDISDSDIDYALSIFEEIGTR